MNLERKHWMILMVTPICLLIDQLSKTYVHGHLRLFDEYSIVPRFFNIAYTQNRGLVFGMFQNKIGSFSTWIFLAITLVALGIIVHLFSSTGKKAVLLPLALCLVLSGALGNLIDRLHWGFVVDFLQLYYKSNYWPTFNAADIWISIGIGLLVLDTIIDSWRDYSAHKAKSETVAPEPEKKGAPGAA